MFSHTAAMTPGRAGGYRSLWPSPVGQAQRHRGSGGDCRAAVEGGAEALTLINTLLGMVIDVEDRKPLLGAGGGGVSGRPWARWR